MHPRSALAFLLALTALVTPTLAAPPNILLIVADDLGYADVGFQGSQDILTPNLDALAASGVRFTDGYVSGPYCSPSRAGLMTGRYPTRFGHEFNIVGGTQGLPVTETTLAERLQAAGYATGLVGKWHLGELPRMHPQKRGFNEFFGFLAGAHDYFPSPGILRGVTPVQETDYLTDAFGREAVAFIDRHQREPWFLYLAFNAVHTPLQADAAWLANYGGIADQQRRTYAAMTSAMDANIGRVLKKVADCGLDRQTLIIFLSDNGGATMPGTTVNGSRNDPLRGSKRTTLEGGVRVPFLLAWPGHVKPGVYRQPVIQLDAYVTALAAAGVAVQPQWALDGANLLPFVTGEQTAAPHPALYWRLGPQMAIRVGDWKLVRYDSNADTNTVDRSQPVTPAKLYHLAADIGETTDLAAAMPERVRQLQAQWDNWNANMVHPLWDMP